MAIREMAEVSETRTRLLLTLLYRDDEVRRWSDHLGYWHRPYDVPEPSPFPFHNLGQAAIVFGRETEDLLLVFMGIHALDHVAAEHLWGEDKRLGYAVYHETYALGLATIAEIMDVPIGLDAILMRLDKAQATRGIHAPLSRSRTRLVRADILMNWSDRFGRREDLLSDALENAGLAVRYLDENGGGRRAAQARVLQARLGVRLAMDETAARTVLAELNDIRSGVDFDALPVLHASWLLARAELGHAFPSVHPDWRQDLATLQTVVNDDTNPSILRQARALLRP